MSADTTFLEAAAQIIPVIFLALALQNFFPALGRAEVEQIREQRRKKAREQSGKPEFDTYEALEVLEDYIDKTPREEALATLDHLEHVANEQIATLEAETDDAVRDAQLQAGLGSILVLFAMVLGEAAALTGLDQQQPNFARAFIAAFGISTGGAALLYPLLMVQLGRLKLDEPPSHRWGVLLAVAVVGGCWLGASIL
jgi:hypothetical protein